MGVNLWKENMKVHVPLHTLRYSYGIHMCVCVRVYIFVCEHTCVCMYVWYIACVLVYNVCVYM